MGSTPAPSSMSASKNEYRKKIRRLAIGSELRRSSDGKRGWIKRFYQNRPSRGVYGVYYHQLNEDRCETIEFGLAREDLEIPDPVWTIVHDNG